MERGTGENLAKNDEVKKKVRSTGTMYVTENNEEGNGTKKNFHEVQIDAKGTGYKGRACCAQNPP